MDNLKEDFLEFQAMTTPSPLALTVKKAKGAYITSTTGAIPTSFSGYLNFKIDGN